MVLWTLLLISLLATQILGRTTRDIWISRSLIDRSAVELAADGGVRLAIVSLLGSDDGRLEADGKVVLSIGGARVAVSVDDETGRVDLNAAPPALLEALLLALDVPAPEARRSAESIVGFRTAKPGSSEHEPRFEVPLDLVRVPGLAPTARQLMMPYVTTFTGKSPTRATQLIPVRRALEMLEDGRGTGASSEGSWTSFALAFGARGGKPQRIMRITAVATGASGARFARTAVVVIQPDGVEDYRVLWWQRSWSGA